MIIKNFIFNGKRLSDFGYVVCSFDGNSDSIDVGSHLVFNTVKSANNEKRRFTSVNFEDVLSCKLHIAKYDCKTDTLNYLDIDDIRTITNWLNVSKNKKLIFLDTEDGYDQVLYLGSFISIDKIKKNSKILGLEISFLSCYPYALSHDVLYTFDVLEGESITLLNDDDHYGYHIPKSVEIKVLKDGWLYIDNNITGLRTSIENCKKDEVITIDGDVLWLSSSDNNHDIHADFNYNFIKIAKNEDVNENVLTFSLPCKISVICNYIRKVGLI